MKSCKFWRPVALAALAGCVCCGCSSEDATPPDSPVSSAQQEKQPNSELASRAFSDAIVRITVSAPGLEAVEIEAAVTLPVETSLMGCPGVERVRSVSRDGEATVWVEFAAGGDVWRNRQIVAERLDTASDQLPAACDAPRIAPRLSSLILLVALRSRDVEGGDQRAETDLRQIADSVLRPRLLTLSGVSQVSVLGGRKRRYEIVVDPNKLMKFGLSLRDVADAIGKTNVSVKADTASREVMIRVADQGAIAEDLKRTVVAIQGGGVPILLEYVAEVRVGSVEDLLPRLDAEANRRAWPKDTVLLAVSAQPDDSAPGRLSAEIDELLAAGDLPATLECLRELPAESTLPVSLAIERLQRDLPGDLTLRLETSDELHSHLVLRRSEDLEVKVLGPDLEVLRKLSEQTRQGLERVPGIGRLQTDAPITIPRLSVKVETAQATLHDVNVSDIALAARTVSSGLVIGHRLEDHVEVDVVLMMSPAGSIDTADRLLEMPVATADGAMVTLQQVAQVNRDVGPTFLRHDQARRCITIRASLEQPLSEILPAVRAALAPIEESLPIGYQFQYPAGE